MATEQKELASLKNLFQKELHDILAKMKEFKTQLFIFVDDNRRLTNEVKEGIQYRISVAEMVENITVLEQTLHDAVQSKNTEVKSPITQEKNDDSNFHNIQDEGLEKRISEVQEHYKRGMSILTAELNDARNEVKNLKQELQRKHEKISEYDILLTKCDNSIANSRRKANEFEKKEQELSERLMHRELELVEDREHLLIKFQEIEELQSQKQELVSLNADLRKENMDLIKSFLKAKKEARTSLAKAEEAIFQKNELILKEEYAQKRIQVIQASMDNNIQNIVSQYKEDHQKTLDTLEKSKQALFNENAMLHGQTIEQQNLLEKTRRENARIYSMLESLRNEKMEHCIPSSVYYELSGKLTECERARDDALFQQTLLENKITEIERLSSLEIKYYEAKAKCANLNLECATKSLNVFVPEREALAEAIEEKTNECEVFQREIVTVKQLLENEINNYKEALSAKTHAFNAQLKTVTETYTKRINKLETLLTTQQAVSQKWKHIALNVASSGDIPMEN